MNKTAYIGVGSNISAERNIKRALELLCGFVVIDAISNCYYSEALERPDQNRYINCVWKIVTSLAPLSLKRDVLSRIEKQLGRVRTGDSYAARTIDLDLILYGEEIIRQEGLIIPDPEITRRNFIAVPLLETAAQLKIPGMRAMLTELAISHDHTGLEYSECFSTELQLVVAGRNSS